MMYTIVVYNKYTFIVHIIVHVFVKFAIIVIYLTYGYSCVLRHCLKFFIIIY